MPKYERLMPGDKVEFICEDNQGCHGTRKGAIYTVVKQDGDYVHVAELAHGGIIYRERFRRKERANMPTIMAPLIVMRDELARNTTEWEMAKKAIEELEKL